MITDISRSNSRNTQKPDGEFISRFQEAFSDIVPRRDSHRGQDEGSFDPRGDVMMSQRYEYFRPIGSRKFLRRIACRPADNSDVKTESHDVKLSTHPNDRTPRNMHELGLTPSWMEPGSYSMMPLSNQNPGFYTPNSGGMGTIFHNQAGDLHTPTGMHLITPLSLAGIPAAQHPHANGFEPFNPQLVHTLHDVNQYSQQPSYAPSAFMHREMGYDAMDGSMGSIDNHVETGSNITVSDLAAQEGGCGDMSYAKGEK